MNAERKLPGEPQVCLYHGAASTKGPLCAPALQKRVICTAHLTLYEPIIGALSGQVTQQSLYNQLSAS